MPAAPLSYVDYTGDGATDIFSLTFPYIDESHVHFYIGTTEVQIVEFVTQSTVRVASAPANGAAIIIRRCTPIATPLVDYFDGSTLGEVDLDTAVLQLLYRLQEMEDDLDIEGISNFGTYEVGAFAPSALNSDEWFMLHPVVTTHTIRASSTAHRATARTASVANVVQTIYRTDSGGSDNVIGTVTWTGGSKVGTVAITADTTLVPGDTLGIRNPLSPDAALTGVGVTLVGDRT